MAQELDDGEFWLPSEFLTDDDLLTDFKLDESKFCFSSDLSSPVESVMGSTETESDEDDVISNLTRQISQSTINLDLSSKGTTWNLGSPQSTLCGCKPNSSRGGSPNSCGSQLSSPSEGTKKEDLGFDLLYAAAGEVAARMRYFNIENDTSPFYPASSNNGFLNYPDISYQQLQATQFLQMKQQQQQQQMMKIGGYQNQSARNNTNNNFTGGLSAAAWPTLQQAQQPVNRQPGSGMRAVFLGETGVKKERTGTGVFLPRRFGTNNNNNNTTANNATAETLPRKKPGCPTTTTTTTVLLPDKVVHALNLNLDNTTTTIGSHHQLQLPRTNNLNFASEYDAALKHRAYMLMAQQMRRHPQPAMSPELRLPQEWTY